MLVTRVPGSCRWKPSGFRSSSPSMLFRWMPVPGGSTPEPVPFEHVTLAALPSPSSTEMCVVEPSGSSRRAVAAVRARDRRDPRAARPRCAARQELARRSPPRAAASWKSPPRARLRLVHHLGQQRERRPGRRAAAARRSARAGRARRRSGCRPRTAAGWSAPRGRGRRPRTGLALDHPVGGEVLRSSSSRRARITQSQIALRRLAAVDPVRALGREPLERVGEIGEAEQRRPPAAAAPRARRARASPDSGSRSARAP